ncbi:MAG: hypothetical protein HRT58_05735 [Crocinitomicaceae bacterium]|nr:hypothetical protein [Flavobacteriales bacterium]NQZ35142.1 hypothetical protein [Crocinitomicaceae bacterium]
MSKLEFNKFEFHMKLNFCTLLITFFVFTSYGQDTNKQRIDRINEILVSTFPENYLLVEKSKIQLNGCELIYIEYLNDNTTRKERHDLNTSEIELVDFLMNPDGFDGSFWTVEVNSFTIGFDIYDKIVAMEMYRLITQLKNRCE